MVDLVQYKVVLSKAAQKDIAFKPVLEDRSNIDARSLPAITKVILYLALFGCE